jgi:predicted solute-binding protein
MDSSSRTSVALVTILLRKMHALTIEPVAMAPDLDAMLERADAALIIGDVALFLDHDAAGVRKIDLGEAWIAATGLPFVYALWAGWPGAVSPADIAALLGARDAGVEHVDDIAAAHAPGDPAQQVVISRYLRDNIRYRLGAQEEEGRERSIATPQVRVGVIRRRACIYHGDYRAD